VYEETLTGRPHDTSVQKATSDNENVDAVERHALDITWCGCSIISIDYGIYKTIKHTGMCKLTYTDSDSTFLRSFKNKA